MTAMTAMTPMTPMTAMTPLSIGAHEADLDVDHAVTGPPRRYHGVHPAVVVDNQDPDGEGRIKVRLPWSHDSGQEEYAVWARLATPMAGPDRGTWFVPENDDEVLVAFGGGHPDAPYVVGSLWNGTDAPPVSMNQSNDIRAIVSREDIRITFDDTVGAVKLTLSTPGGRTITLDDGGGSVRIEDAGGNSIEFTSAGIDLRTSGTLTMKATTIDVSAASGTDSTPMWNYSGVVQCNTVITPTVVGSSYTPGAGNIW